MKMPDVYKSIVKAVKSGKLKEPFSKEDIYKACKADDLKKSTCNSYPTKHLKGNEVKKKEFFEKVSPGKYKLLRPFKNGLQ